MEEKDFSSLPLPDEPAEKSGGGYKFGTFKGVFTPSMLTILGVVMYLRIGWVLGQRGLTQTLIIVTISSAITFLTGLSLSALATNMKIGGGGAYFIISRSLGLETGAAVGLPLYFAQALGISFYIAGFSESLLGSVLAPYADYLSGFSLAPLQVVGIGTLLVISIVAYFSADLALKTQFFIFGLILLSLISFFVGKEPFVFSRGIEFVPLKSKSFIHVFAVFFPAVTGIEAGIAMSGDLKSPAKSLPLGTLGAVCTGYLIYMAIPVILAFRVSSSDLLLGDSLVMKHFSFYGPLILWAVWGASLSSAMGALLGAPRTLQAMARDKIIPTLIGRGFGQGGDPRIATLITFGVALAGILAGGLNFIAPVLSMFFLTSYCLLNVSAAFEGMIASPSWRPRFKVHWSISLLGAVACLSVMIQISYIATVMAVLVTSVIYYIVRRRSMDANWGDLRYGIMMLTARNIIYSLSRKKADEKTWRPNLLVLSGAPTKRWHLIEIADSLSRGRGFLTVAAVVDESVEHERLENLREAIVEHLLRRDVAALAKVHSSGTMLSGAKELVRNYGFGPLVPNTILIGETEKSENVKGYVEIVRMIYSVRKNLIIVRESSAPPTEAYNPEIHVWWGRQRNNAGLMLALAHLMKSSHYWCGARLILKTIVRDGEIEPEEAMEQIETFIRRSRLEATYEVISSGGEAPFEIIKKRSEVADIVFIGMRPPEEDESVEEYSEYYSGLQKKTEGMSSLVKVLASEDIDFQRIFK